MVTTLSPCWYCSGLVRQFGISRVVIGEARTFYGGHDWLAEHGVEVVLLDDAGCVQMMTDFIAGQPGTVERGHRRLTRQEKRMAMRRSHRSEPWFYGDAEDRAAVAAQVDAALRDVGFLLVTGHGVPARRGRPRCAARRGRSSRCRPRSSGATR